MSCADLRQLHRKASLTLSPSRISGTRTMRISFGLWDAKAEESQREPSRSGSRRLCWNPEASIAQRTRGNYREGRRVQPALQTVLFKAELGQTRPLEGRRGAVHQGHPFFQSGLGPQRLDRRIVSFLPE